MPLQEVRRLEHLLEKQNQRIEELMVVISEKEKRSKAAAAQSADGAACLLPPAPGPCTTLSVQREPEKLQLSPKRKILIFVFSRKLLRTNSVYMYIKTPYGCLHTHFSGQIHNEE